VTVSVLYLVTSALCIGQYIITGRVVEISEDMFIKYVIKDAPCNEYWLRSAKSQITLELRLLNIGNICH
jgi:hypothetical protein